MITVLFFLILCALLSQVKCQSNPEDNPLYRAGEVKTSTTAEWFKAPPEPLRTFYVSADASSVKRDGSKELPFRLHDIWTADVARPGDLFVLLGGDYTDEIAHFKLPGSSLTNGTAENPIIVRASPNERVRVYGKFEINGDHIWLWGIEITDPDGFQHAYAGVRVRGNGVRVINCVIHTLYNSDGIFSAHGYEGNVFYGNVMWHVGLFNQDGNNLDKERAPNLIYAVNNYDVTGYKYVVNNVLMDQGKICGEDCHNFYGYSEPLETEEDEEASGYWLEQNIMWNGTILVGGDGPPSHNIVVKNNYIADTRLQVGKFAPTQAEVVDNYIGYGWLDAMQMWGADEAVYTQQKPSRFESNTIFNPTDNKTHQNWMQYAVRLQTAAFSDPEFPELDKRGESKFRSSDVFNRNTYGPEDIEFYIHADNVEVEDTTFENFRSVASAAGLDVDSQSTLAGIPSKPVAKGFVNVYDDSYGYIIIYNWPNDLSYFVNFVDAGLLGIAENRRIEVYDIFNAWAEKPLINGLYGGATWGATFPITEHSMGNGTDRSITIWLVRMLDQKKNPQDNGVPKTGLNRSNEVPIEVIIGSVVAVIVGCIVVAGIVFAVVYMQRQRNRQAEAQYAMNTVTSGTRRSRSFSNQNSSNRNARGTSRSHSRNKIRTNSNRNIMPTSSYERGVPAVPMNGTSEIGVSSGGSGEINLWAGGAAGSETGSARDPDAFRSSYGSLQYAGAASSTIGSDTPTIAELGRAGNANAPPPTFPTVGESTPEDGIQY